MPRSDPKEDASSWMTSGSWAACFFDQPLNLVDDLLLSEQVALLEGVQHRRGLQPGTQALHRSQDAVGKGLRLVGNVWDEDEGEQRNESGHEAGDEESGEPSRHPVAMLQALDERV